ncbi:hypothetical protein GCM10028805_25800 [Spirosoma harenae]
MQYGHISYQGTHQIKAPREDIFRQIRRWTAFHSTRVLYTQYQKLKIPTPSTALLVSDNMLGDVITSGSLDEIRIQPRSTLTYPAVYYSVSAEAYDGYYRITLTNFYILGFPTPHYLDVRDKSTSLKRTRELYGKVDAEIMALIADLEKFVVAEIVSSKR